MNQYIAKITVHYFSRYFKEKENLSPIEYKRTVTETISLHTQPEASALDR